MPEVVKAGPSKHHAKCRKCGCEFSYKTEEVKPNYSLGGGEGVFCPQCSEFHRHWIKL